MLVASGKEVSGGDRSFDDGNELRAGFTGNHSVNIGGSGVFSSLVLLIP
jgi:hypothetical protein